MTDNGLGGPNPLPHHVLSLEQAEDRLNPYKKLLNECIQFGWDAYIKDYSTKHHILCARSRAAIVFDEIKNRAQAIFGALEGVNFVPKLNSFMLYIGDDIVLRFKKLRKNGLCSNINTRQQMLFQAQMCLPGVLAGTLVHAGYLLDDLQHEIIKTLVVCQFENRVLWTIKLTGEGGAIVFTPPAPVPSERGAVARWEFTGEKADRAAEQAGDSAEKQKPN
jgi:hypothetical protein